MNESPGSNQALHRAVTFVIDMTPGRYISAKDTLAVHFK